MNKKSITRTQNRADKKEMGIFGKSEAWFYVNTELSWESDKIS